jgi:Holliday junction resolvase RusA-like endonuclease
MITLTIPMLPPSVNHMYVTCGGGRKALSGEAEAFRSLVLAALCGERPAVPDGPLAFGLYLTFDTKRRQDVDNRIKAAIDAIALALRFDDSRVARIVAERARQVAREPRCVMTLIAWCGGDPTVVEGL